MVVTAPKSRISSKVSSRFKQLAVNGGDSSEVQDQLKGVQQVQAICSAFAAILADGSVVTWGNPDSGGDSSEVQDQLKGVQQVQATCSAFAAILADGSVVTWGDPDSGGDSSAVAAAAAAHATPGEPDQLEGLASEQATYAEARSKSTDADELGIDEVHEVYEVSAGGLRCGDDAFGIVWGCLKTYATTPWQLLVPRPGGTSASAAAALPTVYTTVDVAFAELAKLKKGEKAWYSSTPPRAVLALWRYNTRSAWVYTTAGREEKRQYLRDLGVKYITSSRNGEEFEKEMKEFLKGSDGIHVVLNSLSHDNFIGRSLGLLAKGGRFVEIGKRDVWSVDEVAKFRSDVKYYPLAIDGVCENEPDRYQGLLKRLEKDLQGTHYRQSINPGSKRSGSWKPLEATEFEGLSKGVEALQFLQRAQQIGKAPARAFRTCCGVVFRNEKWQNHFTGCIFVLVPDAPFLPGAAKLAYFGMANLRYLHTFIDEEPVGVELSRSRSCPHLHQPHLGAAEQDNSESAMAAQVAELWQRAQTLIGAMRVAVPDREETESVAADALPTSMGPEEPGLPDMSAMEAVAAEADMLQTEMGQQETSQEEDVPFLCARPCVRLAKGNCYMGDACGYCHHSTHPRFIALDKRQRLQVGIVLSCAEILATVGLPEDKNKFIGTLLPHIRRSLADARIEATELLEIIETEVDAQQVYHRDRHLERTLRQMPLSALLACIVARETVSNCLLQEQIMQLRLSLP
eukprot:s1029_g10.t1